MPAAPRRFLAHALFIYHWRFPNACLGYKIMHFSSCLQNSCQGPHNNNSYKCFHYNIGLLNRWQGLDPWITDTHSFCKLIMFRQIIVCLTLLLVVAGQELTQPGPPDFCFKTSFHINDQYHKDVPSPEGSDFPECQSWKESSCCTLALAETLNSKGKVHGLYNFSHELCDRLHPMISPPCAEFLRVCTITVRYLTMAINLSFWSL